MCTIKNVALFNGQKTYYSGISNHRINKKPLKNLRFLTFFCHQKFSDFHLSRDQAYKVPINDESFQKSYESPYSKKWRIDDLLKPGCILLALGLKLDYHTHNFE